MESFYRTAAVHFTGHTRCSAQMGRCSQAPAEGQPAQLWPLTPGDVVQVGDEDAVGVRSGTLILIHLDRIEHAYGRSKTASSSPDQAMDVSRQ